MSEIYAAPFLKIKDACRVTGMSQSFLRSGCKDGSIPCIRVGKEGNSAYMINVPALLEKLDAESRGGKK